MLVSVENKFVGYLGQPAGRRLMVIDSQSHSGENGKEDLVKASNEI